MNIVYTLNDKFVPQVAACMTSVCENNKKEKEINFYLVSDGITDKNKKELKEYIKKYKRNLEIIELGDIKRFISFEFDTNGWNYIVLSRLFLDKLLPKKLKKVLYMDGDTICRGSLKELWNTDLKGKIIGASIEPTYNNKRKNDLGLTEYPYYNAGVLLIDLEKWSNKNIGEEILEFYYKNNGRLFANDQDAINAVLKDDIVTISPKYNFYNIYYQYPYSTLKRLLKQVDYIPKKMFIDAKQNPTIIHYLGEERPWRIGNHHKYKSDYIKYLDMTPWKGQNFEEGWQLYYFLWYIFNFVTKPFPLIRYKIIDSLIPLFMKYRKKKLKKNK